MACDSRSALLARKYPAMNFRIEARWPSSDILPQAKEAATATTAIKACATFLRAGCVISLIEWTGDDGRVSKLRPRELLRLARAEGCGIRYPPRRRVQRQSVLGVLFAILCMGLPNSFGDFCTAFEFGANRVAIRRSEGARRPERPKQEPVDSAASADAEPTSPNQQAAQRTSGHC